MGVGQRGSISGAAINRLKSVLGEFTKVLQENRADQVTVCATQAFREAANGQTLAEELERDFQLPVEILSGDMEARLSYRAAATGLGRLPDKRIVVDVGGGSSEIIFGAGDLPSAIRSFPIGAVRLAEQFRLADLIAESDLLAAREEVARVFSAVKTPSAFGGVPLILVGGTAMTLAAVSNQTKEFDPEELHGVKLDKQWLTEISTTLAQLNLHQRELLMPFDRERARIIIGGSLILEHLAGLLKSDNIRASNRGLRWGILVAKFGLNLDA
jgi:exopolyphosphatase/guanosine-5'-triphosphate,3'-diphosphate pyrophosphatase